MAERNADSDALTSPEPLDVCRRSFTPGHDVSPSLNAGSGGCRLGILTENETLEGLED